jgi:hypothetical protein
MNREKVASWKALDRMGILTDDMKRIVRDQRLGYIATASTGPTGESQSVSLLPAQMI